MPLLFEEPSQTLLLLCPGAYMSKDSSVQRSQPSPQYQSSLTRSLVGEYLITASKTMGPSRRSAIQSPRMNGGSRCHHHVIVDRNVVPWRSQLPWTARHTRQRLNGQPRMFPKLRRRYSQVVGEGQPQSVDVNGTGSMQSTLHFAAE